MHVHVTSMQRSWCVSAGRGVSGAGCVTCLGCLWLFAVQYSTEFMVALMNSPALIRSVAIVGNLHHGKTSFTDLLIQQTHEKRWAPDKEVRDVSCAGDCGVSVPVVEGRHLFDTTMGVIRRLRCTG